MSKAESSRSYGSYLEGYLNRPSSQDFLATQQKKRRNKSIAKLPIVGTIFLAAGGALDTLTILGEADANAKYHGYEFDDRELK